MSIKNQNWIALTSIQVGGAICLPVLLIGFELARRYGLPAALVAIALGNSILFGLSLIGACLSTASEKTTVETAEQFLGKRAKLFFAIVMSLSLCLWFSIQAQMMAQDVLLFFSSQSLESIVSFGIAILIVVCALAGIKSIETLSNLAVPLMVATMVIAVCKGAGASLTPRESKGLDGQAVSLILAAAIAAVVDMPTFFRHALNRKEAIKASVATFLVGTPFVELLGALLGSMTEADSLIDALYCFDNALWRAWILVFILLAGWTTNNANLYSAAMSMRSVMKDLSEKQAILYVGIGAALLSLCNVLHHLGLFLDVMGVCISSMGGVVFAAFCLKRTANVTANSVALILGVATGIVSHVHGGLITGVAILDSLIASFAFTVIVDVEDVRIWKKI